MSEWKLTWDTCENCEYYKEDLINDVKNENKEVIKRICRERDLDEEEFINLPEKEKEEIISNYAYSDSDYSEICWEQLCDDLTEKMQEINPKNKDWFCEVNNFGWRHQSGEKRFDAETGLDLLRQVLPQCDCTFTIYMDGEDGFKINNAHHDAPCGGEMYYVKIYKEEEDEN